MGNRAQRRASQRNGKKPGETYADVLAKKKMIERVVRESVHDRSISTLYAPGGHPLALTSARCSSLRLYFILRAYRFSFRGL